MNISQNNASKFRHLVVDCLRMIRCDVFDRVIGPSLDVVEKAESCPPFKRVFNVVGSDFDVDVKVTMYIGSYGLSIREEPVKIHRLANDLSEFEVEYLTGRIQNEINEMCYADLDLEKEHSIEEPIFKVSKQSDLHQFGHTLSIRLDGPNLADMSADERIENTRVLNARIAELIEDGLISGDFWIDLKVKGQLTKFLCEWDKE
ncbi:hypothetical protein [Vibrio owensii]|uniref:hypothetical protein n=1 Tax=Vibrio owensii TaxID=696485 RepID=UPI0018F1559C|nr:hypothetical protein [Vibrio owensii]